MTTKQTVVGVLELASKYRYGLTSRGVPMYLFRPYDETLPDYIVGCSERNISQNRIAHVSISQTTASGPLEKPRGELVSIFGPVGDQVAETAALLKHYCPYTHRKTPVSPPDTQFDADRIEISPATGWRTWHVDPPGCRDIDDAIALNSATGEMAIVIADAAAVVSTDSACDRVAAAIGASFYDIEGCVCTPMLPPEISENSGSLLPNERRRGIALIGSTFQRVWITVAESYTYDSFESSELAAEIGVTDSHAWIEKQMIRYNVAVARLLKQVSHGILRQQLPSDKGATWAALHPALKGVGVEAATYASASDAMGHAALGLDAYTHATSPLRRYVDLCNQRILHQILSGETPSYTISPENLNEREAANKRWARDLTFLTHVTPGRVHVVDIIWMGDGRVFVPAWRRVIRVRHDCSAETPGTEGHIKIFCDPTRRNWKRRILTAPANDVPAIEDGTGTP
jgi:exoribonuclease R